MKKVKMLVSAALVFAVVGSALAFKASIPNIRFCDQDTQTCVAQAQFSTVPFGNPVTPPSQPYTGTVGAECNSVDCPQFNGNVYINL